MQKKLLAIGSLSGLICVVLGAFGAHALKGKLELEQLNIFETAVRYQFFHSLAIILSAVLIEKLPAQKIHIAGYLFTTGIILFSGSLYFMVAGNFTGLGNMKWLGAITPIGGLFFIAGWLSLFLFSLKKNEVSK